MITNVTTAIILDTRRQKKNGVYPLKLRVTYKRRQKYYSIGIDLTDQEYKKVISPKPRDHFKELKRRLNTIEDKAQAKIDNLNIFSFELFESSFRRRNDGNDVYIALQEYMNALISEGRIGSAISYRVSLNSLKSYKKNLSFEEVTPSFLKSYEKWMLLQDKSTTTIGIYLRNLRRVFNKAISLGIINPMLYPFGKDKYQIPKGKNVKKALSDSDLKKVLSFEIEGGSMKEKCRDLWVFSYLCNGANIKDIARLKFENIEDGIITFYRAKTERTSMNKRPIKVALIPEMKKIINKWGNAQSYPDDYIFPVIHHGISPEKEHAVIGQTVKNINKYMRIIAQEAEIDKDITTYTARHSFSTKLKREGASTEFIQDSMGHSNVAVTQDYLDSFPDDKIKKMAKKLTKF